MKSVFVGRNYLYLKNWKKEAPAPMLFYGSERRLRLFSLVRKELRIEKNNFIYIPLWM